MEQDPQDPMEDKDARRVELAVVVIQTMITLVVITLVLWGATQ